MNVQKSLNAIFEGFATPLTQDRLISGMTLDSRQVQAGDVFFALAGRATLCKQHCEQAIAAGAIALCVDAQVSYIDSNQLPVMRVQNLAAQCSALAARFYDHPSKAMQVIAVTGTNGKTSVTQFIATSLEALGKPCGLIGTLGSGRVGQLNDNGMTTPDPLLCQKLLAEFRDQGLEYVVMEASSHALVQHRLDAIDIDIAVLTNLSRDHLDYHGSMQAYADAKQRLFMLPSVRIVVINKDEIFGQTLLKQGFSADVTCLRYGLSSEADWWANNIKYLPLGMHFDLISDQQHSVIQLSLMGQFNVANVLATASVLAALQFQCADICSALSQLHSVKGRMQLVTETADISVIVDYAHTPDALEQALIAMRQHLEASGKLWCVFGCGGDRDKGKRPMMGQVAHRYADRIVLTDDNPRTEHSEVIIDGILEGIEAPIESVVVETDRHKAIIFAIDQAVSQDMILVAGKGHEAYQERQGARTPFSDEAVIRAALHQRQIQYTEAIK